jgi:dihydrofolate reductase
MPINLVVAMAQNRVIGYQNQLPWHLPDDLRHFKNLTSGHVVLMGRKTFESIGKPLPKRENIVVSRNPDWTASGVTVYDSLEKAMTSIENAPEIFIIGGAEIYRQALPFATRLYVTSVLAEVKGDAFFPAWDPLEWVETSQEFHPADDRHAFGFYFLTLERK